MSNFGETQPFGVEPEQVVLDEYSQEYHPFQQIVPDVQQGFDANGDFHAVHHEPESPFVIASSGLGQAIAPYRWASYLEDAVTQLCMGNDYYTGRAERCDMAEQILEDRMNRASSEQEKIELQKAMQIWYRSYGGSR
jgi:hypothetical protein